jgi:hypothetical protein
MHTVAEMAQIIRKLVGDHNEAVLQLENFLRYAREQGLEIELLDGVNMDVAHDLDGLTAYRLKVVKILNKMPL